MAAISPIRSEDFPEWYQQVVRAAELAENSDVRGCMVIKPWGYGIWEQIQQALDAEFKATGHQNAYFPLFIPLSYLEKEAAHVEGFAKECAVVTHHRLEQNDEGKLVPAGELNEPLIVRPTSETIIGATYAKWVQSYRDLPILINQWANVVRWEMRTRVFLRTAEFLWQEGHTAHETAQEAEEETERMLQVYKDFVQGTLAIPLFTGPKPESERFPGAIETYTIEAMMQDRKALQGGTSHFLGQNFSKASAIQFTARDNSLQYAWTTSWGVSTRLIGGLVMTHADDDGMIVPPAVAPQHAVILPVTPKPDSREQVLEACRNLAADLGKKTYRGQPIRVKIDDRDVPGGTKNWEWIKRGVPLRIEIGPRDLEKGAAALARRDRGPKEKAFPKTTELVEQFPAILEEIQTGLFERALTFRDAHVERIDEKEAFYRFFTPQSEEKPEIHGGFAYTHWCGDPEVEEQIKHDLKVTIRCLPRELEVEPGTCPFTGKPSPRRVLFAKSY